MNVQQEIAHVFGVNEWTLMQSDTFRTALSRYINEMAVQNIHRLYGLLYQLDINEKKLKLTLQKKKGTDAGDIIADAIILRQMEKIESRKKFHVAPDSSIPEDEKW